MSRFTTCGLTILLAFAPVALAVDGTVLINQSTIANGLPGCPTGGLLPIIICQSGSYRLSGNITVPDVLRDAIDINVDNVTLDLNGFSIIGPVVCSGGGNAPITCSQNGNAAGISSGNSNITVSNGIIRGIGGTGVSLGGSGVLIERVKAVSNSFSGISAGGDAIVALCHADFNGNNGFEGQGTISNSSSLHNNKVGMVWSGTITGSISNFNGDKAFDGAGVFIGNEAAGNRNAGIKAENVSVIISNGVYLSSTPIIAPSGSVVLNNATP